MIKFWTRRYIQFFLLSAVLGIGCVSSAFAETDSMSLPAAETNKDKIDPKEIQKALTEAGFYKGAVDGVIGKKTRAAIRAFQTENGLTADGVCGAKTWEKLKTYLEKTAEPTADMPTTTAQESFSPTTDQGTTESSVSELEPPAQSDDLRQKLVS